MIYSFNHKTLKYDNVSKKILIYAVLGVLAVAGIVTAIMMTRINDVRFLTQETKEIIIREGNEKNAFTPERLKSYILELNIKFPHIVYAQAQLESGEFKSHIFRENNNLFGLKCAKIRPTTNLGENNGHAYFENWRDCVIDYAMYSAAYLQDIKTESEYFQYLGQNYAEDPNYVAKLKQIIAKSNVGK
jgi:hypothetical protein